MTSVKVYNLEGKSVGEKELPANIFNIELNTDLVHQAVIAQQANSREAIAHTKTRSEVRGGGRKPWKQKGTGRARHGSTRSPLWKGGGVTFGPRNDRNFSMKINKKMKNKALRMTLSGKAQGENILVMDSFGTEAIKTKDLKALLGALPSAGKTVLIVMGAKNEAVFLAARNLVKVRCIAADSLNVVDVLKYDYLLADADALQKIETVYGK